MKSEYWIQKADFSAESFDASSLADAIHSFKNINWPSLEKQRDLMEDKGDECCDPGIGFVPNDTEILHIALMKGNTFYIHYHYSKKGLLWDSDKISTKFDIDWSDVPTFIELFFKRDHDILVEKLSA